jgi:hypothetical protein
LSLLCIERWSNHSHTGQEHDNDKARLGLSDSEFDSFEQGSGVTEQFFDSRHRNKCNLCRSTLEVNFLFSVKSGFHSLIQAHDLIVDSRLPNFQGCRIPVTSKINIGYLRSELQDYTDVVVCDLLEFGFPVGFEEFQLATSKRRNHSGARFFDEAMDKYMVQESSYGAIVGPFKKNPFGCEITFSPLNSVPKKDTQERRVILDLSFPKGGSVNDYVSKDWYLGERVTLTYPKVDDLVDLIKMKGKGCLLFKRDLKRAYRQIPIDPGDMHLLAYCWKNHIFVDRVLPMGLRSAAHVCQRVTSAISYILLTHGFVVLNYLDDFAGAEEPATADIAFLELAGVLRDSGLEESVHKACSPSTQMAFVGVWYDTIELTLSVSKERVEEILGLVCSWIHRSTATKKDLQSILGKLHFVAQCVRPGRIFVSRLLNWLRSVSEQGEICIPVEVKKDFQWWAEFLPLYNGVSMMPFEDWESPDDWIASDACLTGCGGWCAQTGEFFHSEFPSGILESQLHINALEMLSLTVCLKIWSAFCLGKRVKVFCDNLASVTVINTGATRDVFLQTCLREICMLAAQGQFEIRAVHIAGVDNRLPDLLSRWHLDARFGRQFCEVTRGQHLSERHVIRSDFLFTHDW